MCRPPRRDHLVVLGAALVVEALVDVFPGRRRHAVEVVELTEVDELLVVDVLLLATRHTLGDFLGEALLPRHVLGVAAEQDVGAAAGHVGGHRDLAEATGLGDDFGFLRVVLRVQHDVLHALALQHRREQFRLLDRDRADEHGPALRPAASAMSSTIASYFSRCVRKTVSGSSMRIRGRLVGTWITSSL